MKLQITTVVVFPVLFPAMFPSFPNSNPLIREPAIVLRLLFLKFVWMLRVKSKQQNTRPNRTYFSNDKTVEKCTVFYGYVGLPTSRLLLNSPRWLNTVTGGETGCTSLQLMGSCINPFITHPAHERLYHTTGVDAYYSGFFYAPTRIRTVKEL